MTPRLSIAIAAAGLAVFGLGGAAGQDVRIGVENSQAFRASEKTPSIFGAPGSRTVTALAGFSPSLEPLTFADQVELLGADAFHFPVYADPKPGRYARGPASSVAALRASGLKVVDPGDPDPDALCFTLMTCLMTLDAWAQFRAEPLFVVLDARAEPRPGRLARVKAVALADERPASPTWTQLALEVETALPAQRRSTSPDGEAGKITVIVRGGRGDMPSDAPFLAAGDEGSVRLLDVGAPAWAITRAVGEAQFVGVVGARWSGEADARALAAAGVRLILVDPDAARAPPAG